MDITAAGERSHRMFERFSEQARQVVVAAQHEAVTLGHQQIGTEHLLLGIAGGAGAGADVLRALGITPDAAREQIIQISGQGPVQRSGHIPFTSRAKAALEQALREALSFGHEHIGTEHLLLGLVEDPEAQAVRVLADRGVTPAQVREQVIRQAPPGIPIPIPPLPRPRPRRAAGPMRAGDVAAFLSSADSRLAAIDSKLAAIDSKLAAADSRLAAIDSRLAAIERHLGLPGQDPPAAGSEAG